MESNSLLYPVVFKSCLASPDIKNQHIFQAQPRILIRDSLIHLCTNLTNIYWATARIPVFEIPTIRFDRLGSRKVYSNCNMEYMWLKYNMMENPWVLKSDTPEF